MFIVACVVLAGCFAGVETGAYRLNRIRLRHMAESGSAPARMLRRVVSNMERFICLTLLGHNAAVYGATALCTGMLVSRFETHLSAELVGTLVMAPILLVCAEVLPKSIFHVFPNRLMRWSSPLLWCANILCWPVVALLAGVVGFWRQWLGGVGESRRLVVSSQYFDFLLTEGREEGVISPQQDLMVHNIMQFGKRPVRSVMIPLEETRMLCNKAAGEEVVKTIGRYNHPRLPVYAGRPENVVGILFVLDYLSAGAAGEVEDYLRDPDFVPADMPLDHAFKKLQDAGQTLGVVVDEGRRAIGIVTMGDLLQEIFASLGEA